MSKPDQNDDHRDGTDDERVPALQRLCERPFVLLLLGLLVMIVFYTAWGLYEITTLPPSALP